MTNLGKARVSSSTVTTAWAGSSSQAHADNKKEGAAALKSTAGSAPSSFKVSAKASLTHEEVGRVTIRYTSDFGLAVRGLLKDEDEQRQSAAAASSALPRAKRRRDEASRPAASSSSAAAVTIDDDSQDEKKPAVSARATGFTNGEVVDLLDSD